MGASVVFIAGARGSGATVVAQSLAAESGAAHVGEVQQVFGRGVLGNGPCECGEPFDRCPFWTEVLAKAYGGSAADVAADVAGEVVALSAQLHGARRLPRLILRRGGSSSAQLARYRDLVAPLYDAMASVSNAPALIDSSADPSYLLLLATFPQLELRPIHLVRDSRAVALGARRAQQDGRQGGRPGGRPGGRQQQVTGLVDVGRSALRWSGVNATMELYKWRRGSALELRYEDFAREPERAVSELRQALGAPLRAIGEPVFAHALSRSPQSLRRRPIMVGQEPGWPAAMPAALSGVVTALTAPLLRYYGYRVRRPGGSTR